MVFLRVLKLFLVEAVESLGRGWRLALPALITIASAVAVVGAFLTASATAGRVLAAWSETAELSVFLDAGIADAARARVEAALRDAPAVAAVAHVDRAEAAWRFAREFPDLAPLAASLGTSPFPASYEARLRPGVAVGETDALVARLRRLAGVVDVRYDRALIDRAAALLETGRRLALVIAALLGLSAAVVVASVVRLSYASRRDEVEILLLVGAPLAAIRGPFVVEGFVQGTLGALAGLAVLAAGFAGLRARFGTALAAALGADRFAFLPWTAALALVVASALVGALAGWLAVGRRQLVLRG